MEKEDHKRHSDGPKEKNVRLDRHSANGTDPGPKKGGYAGWGTMEDDLAVEVVDKNDPNYSDEDEKHNDNDS